VALRHNLRSSGRWLASRAVSLGCRFFVDEWHWYYSIVLCAKLANSIGRSYTLHKTYFSHAAIAVAHGLDIRPAMTSFSICYAPES